MTKIIIKYLTMDRLITTVGHRIAIDAFNQAFTFVLNEDDVRCWLKTCTSISHEEPPTKGGVVGTI